MKESLQIFNFNENNIRTFVDEHNEIWFCLTDICKILGINNAGDIVKRLDKDGIDLIDTVDSIGRKNSLNFINEPNLYLTIGRSDKPEAMKFNRWIAKEVIPSIRKTGQYGIENLSRLEILKIALDSEEKRIALEEQNKILLPKATSYDDFMNSDNLMSMNEVSKVLKSKGIDIGEFRLFKFLRDKGILYYSSGCNVPKQKYLERGYFKVKEKVVNNEIGNKQTTFVTKKGFEYIQKKIKKEYKGGKL